ncbi:hypothetical protein F3I62_00645 [Pseudomonas sp. R-28-1W-6]|uniref:hypothetical protein n=1 Tax=Pseudomonas sp. R-28-1W-6 TaxID=2650101 RepID=UPI00136625E0|nr:hypothetical protein [Pseudomonas sp. R-28-1W-6]MWV10584.1 hypothetical protein [Pseudomonas sp. R-28-1W-6]
MPHSLAQHTSSGLLAGLGLCAIGASVVLALGLNLDHALPASNTAGLPELARGLLASIRIGG